MTEERRMAACKFGFFLFLIFAIPALFVAGLGYFSLRSFLQTNALKHQAVFVDAKHDAYEFWIDQQEIRTSDLALDHHVREMTQRIASGACSSEPPISGSCPAASDLSRYLIEKKIPFAPTLVLVDVLDRNGVVVASSDISRIGEHEGSERIGFDRAFSLKSGDVFLFPEVVHEPDELRGEPMLHFTAPIFHPETGAINGVLFAHVLSKELDKIVYTEAGSTSEVYLVSSNRLMMTPSRYVKDAVLRQRVDTPPVRACFERGADYVGIYSNYRGERVVGASRCSPGLGVLLSETSLGEALRSVVIMRYAFFIALSVTSLIVLLYFTFKSRFRYSRRQDVPLAGRAATVAVVASVAGLIVMYGIGFALVFSAVLESAFFQRETASRASLVSLFVQKHGFDNRLFSLPSGDSNANRFKAFFSDFAQVSPGTVGASFFSSEGKLLHTTTERKIKETDIETKELAQLRSGAPVHERVSAARAGEFGLRHLSAMYTPIVSPDKQLLGYAEIYFDSADIVLLVGDIRRWTAWITIVFATSVSLLIALFFSKQKARYARKAQELASLIEHSPVGVYTLDSIGRITSFSPKMVELAGAKSAEEVIGLNALELPTYKRVGLDRFFRDGLAGKPFEAELPYVSYTGKKKTWRHYRGVPIFSPDGKTVEQLLLMVSDITERMKLREELEVHTKNLESLVEESTRDLRESERRYHGLVDAIPDAVIVHVDTVIVFANKTALSMFRYPREEDLIGRSIFDLILPEMRATIRDRIARLLKEEKVPMLEQALRRRDRSTVDAEVSPVAVTYQGKPAVLLVIHDITERKRELREREMLQRLSIDILSAKNVREAYAATLKEIAMTTGWAYGEVWVKSEDEDRLVCCPAEYVSTSDLQSFREATESFSFAWGEGLPGRVWKTKQSEWIPDVTTDSRFPRAPHAKKAGLKTGVGIPILADGEVVAIMAFYQRDVREEDKIFMKIVTTVAAQLGTYVSRKLAEDHMRFQALLLEQVRNIVIATDIRGKIVYWNEFAERATGWLKKNLLGKDVRQIRLFEDPGANALALPDRLLQKGHWEGEVVCHRSDDMSFPVFVSGTVARDAEGKTVGMIGIGVDITERKKAEERVHELNELRKKFIQIVSHQLRTPLNSIRWNLEALLSEELGKLQRAQKEFVRLTHEANLGVIRRIRDLLTALDIEEGRSSLAREELSIESLWASVLMNWKKKCLAKDLVCTYRTPEQPLPMLNADSNKLREIFEKLVENAVVYTPNLGKIDAALKSSDGFVRFEIRDTGIGIPEGEKLRIFTRFYRASNASTMQPDASGLGLYIAKHYAEDHGGKMGFESKEGSGSLFWFEIPVAAKA